MDESDFSSVNSIDTRRLDPAKPYVCVCCPNGEWPTVNSFQSEIDVVQFMASLEGQDVVVIPLYGTVLPFTPGPQRYLILNDGENALPIPIDPTDIPDQVSADYVKSARQDNFYLGPPQLYGTRTDDLPVVGSNEADGDDEQDDQYED